MSEWLVSDLRDKMDSEGGWWEFYMWGGLAQTTGVPLVDEMLAALREVFVKAEDIIETLDRELGV